MLTISCEAAEGPLVEVSIDVAELEVTAHVLSPVVDLLFYTIQAI